MAKPTDHRWRFDEFFGAVLRPATQSSDTVFCRVHSTSKTMLAVAAGIAAVDRSVERLSDELAVAD